MAVKPSDNIVNVDGWTREDRLHQWVADHEWWLATDRSPETEPMPADYAL